MALRYIIETINPNGSKEVAAQELTEPEILLGRGSDCQIRLSSRLVSLNHAKLSVQEETLTLSDLGSLAGIRINDVLVSSQRLQSGDIVSIADIHFLVLFRDGTWELREERKKEERKPKAEDEVIRKTRALEISSSLPSFAKVSLLLSSLVFVLFFLLPLTGVNRTSWSSGPMSNAHTTLEANCRACHENGFVPVQDKACQTCHVMTDHAEVFASLPKGHSSLQRCASCHMEHNGDNKIIAEHPELCTSCHENLQQLHPETKIKAVSHYSNHPEFNIGADDAAIKLNHKVHLEPDLAGPEGLTTLECSTCHELAVDKKTILPIRYEKHCADCHLLEFDERLPGKSVPHAAPEIVYNTLYAEYAKLFLAKDGEIPPPLRSRIRPGGSLSRAEKIEFTKNAVVEESRKQEKEIFEKTACYECHNISQNPKFEEGLTKLNRYLIETPNIKERWMAASVFDHGAHDSLGCLHCHEGVKNSTETRDVLLPNVANCQQCHAQEKSPEKVGSPCISCHSFHEPILMKFTDK